MLARAKAMVKFRKQNYSNLSLTFKSIELPTIADSDQGSNSSSYQLSKPKRRSSSQEFMNFNEPLGKCKQYQMFKFT